MGFWETRVFALVGLKPLRCTDCRARFLGFGSGVPPKARQRKNPAPGEAPASGDFVDLHCHLLPGVDDGATNVTETLAMLKVAHAGGTRRIVATPHLFHPAFRPRQVSEIRDFFAVLQEDLERFASEPQYSFLNEISIDLGGEHRVSSEFFTALANGAVLPLGGGQHLLVELDPFLPWPTVQTALLRVREAGLIPVVAHVERFPVFHDRLGRLASLRETGCLIQVNADAVVGQTGRASREASRRFLKHGLVDIIASDGHRPGYRLPDLRQVYVYLTRGKYESQTISSWLREAPARALDSAYH
jgi:protein-tyrosine phosphatase